jgi:hypothetical protein
MLKTRHFFPFIKMVKALDIKGELKEMYRKTRGKTPEELAQLDETEGIDYLFLFVEKLPGAEREVMEFLVVYTGKTREELDNLDLDETYNIVKEVLTDERFQRFFQQAVK